MAANETGGLGLYEAGFSSMESFVQYEMKSTGHIGDILYDGGQICLLLSENINASMNTGE